MTMIKSQMFKCNQFVIMLKPNSSLMISTHKENNNNLLYIYGDS